MLDRRHHFSNLSKCVRPQADGFTRVRRFQALEKRVAYLSPPHIDRPFPLRHDDIRPVPSRAAGFAQRLFDRLVMDAPANPFVFQQRSDFCQLCVRKHHTQASLEPVVADPQLESTMVGGPRIVVVVVVPLDDLIGLVEKRREPRVCILAVLEGFLGIDIRHG